METQLEAPNVFAETVRPILRNAKERGATARSLSETFLAAMTALYGDVELKETAAMIGFIKILRAEGGSLNAKDAAKLYGGVNNYTEEAVRKAARSGQLLAIRDGNDNLHFPVWQFGERGGTLPGFKEVLARLHRIKGDDLSPATFFLNATERLGGLSPLEALRKGDAALIDQVKQLAEETAE